jgi:3-methylcrotonyl-CoA carboxylase alpha subunit
MMVRRVHLRAGPREAAVDVAEAGAGVTAKVGDHEFTFTVEQVEDGVFLVTSATTRRVIYHARAGSRHLLHLDGQSFAFDLGPDAARRRTAGHHHDLAAPMPGVVTRILVEEGQAVAAGDPLFVVEAMKMEHLVRAPSAGRVTRLALPPGAQVDGGAIVVEVEDTATSDGRRGAGGSAS